MRGAAVVFDELADEPVAGARVHHVALGIVGDGHVHLHGDVAVVEAAFSNDLLLAAEEAELALVAKLAAVVDFNVLLSRHGKEHDVASEVIHRARFLERLRDGNDVGNLDVVPAAVRGARHRIAVGMRAADDGVEFAEKGNRAL